MTTTPAAPVATAPVTPFTRSLIERSIAAAKAAFARERMALPPLANWSIDEWQAKGDEADELRACMIGWDVTDFGSGDFTRIGRTLFTVRNGSARDAAYPKTYAEKIIYDPEGQRAPPHFHRTKREDIINRGGGNVMVRLALVDADGKPTDEALTVQVDGQRVHLPANGTVRLRPGQSLCIRPRMLHQFWGEEGTGDTVTGEVSSVCDDWNDNVFYGGLTRFPPIIEDAPRVHYLCHEYPAAKAATAAR